MQSFLSEFLYSAILWGTLTTLCLWWLKRRCTRRIDHWLVTPPLIWFALHTVIAWYGFLLPPSGRLVDADTGRPLANQRVIAHWASYPIELWTTVCSGQQAHLTDAEGDFAFRLAPYPTLLIGTLLRGLNPEVPGRVDHSKMSVFPLPLWGEIPVKKFAHDEPVFVGENLGCQVAFASQYPNNMRTLPGEAHPFVVMLEEACIEQRPWTLTDWFMVEMMRNRPTPGRSALYPPNIQSLNGLIGRHGCAPGKGGVCAQAIAPDVRDQFCAYFKTFPLSTGDRQ